MLPVNKIIQGSALDQLKTLPENSIDCCITSPPYWNLRDYKVEDQLGREKDFHIYIQRLIEIFYHVKRVIKDTGSIFVNIGDSYNENKSLVGIPERFALAMTDQLGLIRRNTIIWHKPNPMPSSIKDRFTIDFEYLYFFTKSKNYHFETQYEQHKEYDQTKLNNARKMGWNGELKDYKNWYMNERPKKGWTDHSHDKEQGYGQQSRKQKPPIILSPYGRIKTTVWKIATRPFSGAHFATYPEELIRSPILATVPEYICDKCGIPRKHIYEEIRINTRPGTSVKPNVKSRTENDPHAGLHNSDYSKKKPIILRKPVLFGGAKASGYGPRTYSGNEYQPVLRRLKQMGSDNNGEYEGQSIKDYESNKAQNASDTKRRILESYKNRAESKYVMTKCDCNSSFHAGIVLDPFMGAGTTALVALKHNRNFIGIELNKEYIDIAMKRLEPYLLQAKITEHL